MAVDLPSDSRWVPSDSRRVEREGAAIETPLVVAVLTAARSGGRVGRAVATWFLAQTSRHDLKVDLIELAGLGLPVDLGPDPAVQELGERVGAADAVVVLTPEYNHGYPAVLKVALDCLRAEWAAKPVGFVSYGGPSGGLLAVEQLRQVCAELHMVTLRDSVSFHDAQNQFDDAGRPLHGPEVAATAVDRLLTGLTWWGWALRRARAQVPYPV